MRDNFTSRTRQALAERVAFYCSNPDCDRPTVGPHTKSDKALRLGRAAHICAAAPGGPRYDPLQSPADRRSIANGIWLCVSCADIIDREVERHSSSMLHEWKRSAEERTLRRLLTGLRPVTNTGDVGPERVSRVNRLLDEAFDALAGAPFSTRITWRGLTPAAIEHARRAVSEAASIDPASDRVRLVRALYYMAKAFPDKALEEISKIRIGRLSSETQLLKARCYYDLGRTEESRLLLEELCNDGSAPASAFYNIGVAHVDAGATEAAEAAFLKAVQKDDRYGEAYDRLAEIAYRRGDLDLAAQRSSRAHQLRPTDIVILRHYALILLDQDRPRDAVDVLSAADTSRTPDGETLMYLGRAYGQCGDFNRAEQILRRAGDLIPTEPLVQHNLGMVFVFTGRFEQARQAFDKSLALGHPRPEEIQDNLRALAELERTST